MCWPRSGECPTRARYYHLLILLCMDYKKASALGAARPFPPRIARAREHRQPWILWKICIRRGKLAHHKHRSPLRFHAPRIRAFRAQTRLHWWLRCILVHFASITHQPSLCRGAAPLRHMHLPFDREAKAPSSGSSQNSTAAHLNSNPKRASILRTLFKIQLPLWQLVPIPGHPHVQCRQQKDAQ